MTTFAFPLRRWAPMGFIAMALLLGACSGDWLRHEACEGNNFGLVHLQPGCSTVCTAEPCEVYFQMPAGEGQLRVVSPGIPIGTYPAGKKVFLGSFWAGSYVFSVEDSDAPPTHLYVLGTVGG